MLMPIVFRAQIDYLYFLNGLVLVILGVVCVALGKGKDRHHIRWRWLALFAALQGISEWLGLFSIEVRENSWSWEVHTIIASAALLFLAEFGRGNLERVHARTVPGRWVYLPLFAVAAPGLFAGIDGASLSFRIIFGMVGGAATGYLLLRTARCGDPRDRPLLVAGWMMTGYALLTGVSLPRESDALSTAVLGVPVELLEAILMAVMAASLWRYYEAQCREELGHSRLYAGTFSSALVGILLLMTAAGGWVYTEWNTRHFEEKLQERLMARTAATADFLDRSHVRKLTATPQDDFDPVGVHLRQRLALVKRLNPDVRWLYLMKLNNGEIRFSICDMLPYTRGWERSGGAYYDAPEGLHRVFRAGKQAVIGPYADHWGAFVSGFVPIVDPLTGAVIAVLGMDINAGNWFNALRHARFQCILFTLLISILIVAFFLILQWHRRASLRLLAAEKRFRTLVEGSPNGVALVDPALRFLSINAAGLRTMGRKEDEVIGRHISDVLSGWSPDAAKALERARQGSIARFEIDHQRPDGAKVTWQVLINPLMDGDGHIISYCGIFNDITELREKQKALQLKNAAMEMAAVPIGISDLEGTIMYVNEAFLRLWGYCREEVIGRSVIDFSCNGTQMKERLMAVWKDGSWIGELTGQRKDGTKFSLLAYSNVIREENDRPLCLIGSYMDITEKNRIRDELLVTADDLRRKNQELQSIRMELAEINRGLEERVSEKTARVEHLLRQKNEFMYRLGHDLKTPLTPLIALLPLIEKEQRDARLQKMTAICNGSARNMNELVQRTMELFRLDSLKFELTIEALPLADEIEKTLTENDSIARRQDIHVENAVEPSIMVNADRLHLRKVFGNLFDNASRSLLPGGIITIRAEADGCMIRVSVADNGAGIGPEHLAKVFDDFYKVDSSRHDRHTVGLGLSICRRIIERHGGCIWGESEGPGKGTTIRFTIPAA